MRTIDKLAKAMEVLKPIAYNTDNAANAESLETAIELIRESLAANEAEKAARIQAQLENVALKERMARLRIDLMTELQDQGWTPPGGAPAMPAGWRITEAQHIAACKVLRRGRGLDRLPQRMVDAMLAVAPAAPVAVPLTWNAPSTEAAHAMGANGGTTVEAERLAFEAWMRGHCWALCATWTGTEYLSDAERDGAIDPRAIKTRQLWAAWRDRAALANGGRRGVKLEGGE